MWWQNSIIVLRLANDNTPTCSSTSACNWSWKRWGCPSCLEAKEAKDGTRFDRRFRVGRGQSWFWEDIDPQCIINTAYNILCMINIPFENPLEHISHVFFLAVSGLILLACDRNINMIYIYIIWYNCIMIIWYNVYDIIYYGWLYVWKLAWYFPTWHCNSANAVKGQNLPNVPLAFFLKNKEDVGQICIGFGHQCNQSEVKWFINISRTKIQMTTKPFIHHIFVQQTKVMVSLSLVSILLWGYHFSRFPSFYIAKYIKKQFYCILL